MRYILILFLLFGLAGCVTTTQNCCPPKDVIIVVEDPNGFMQPIIIRKGFLDEQYRDESWVDLEEFNEATKELEEEPKQGI